MPLHYIHDIAIRLTRVRANPKLQGKVEHKKGNKNSQ